MSGIDAAQPFHERERGVKLISLPGLDMSGARNHNMYGASPSMLSYHGLLDDSVARSVDSETQDRTEAPYALYSRVGQPVIHQELLLSGLRRWQRLAACLIAGTLSVAALSPAIGWASSETAKVDSGLEASDEDIAARAANVRDVRSAAIRIRNSLQATAEVNGWKFDFDDARLDAGLWSQMQQKAFPQLRTIKIKPTNKAATNRSFRVTVSQDDTRGRFVVGETYKGGNRPEEAIMSVAPQRLNDQVQTATMAVRKRNGMLLKPIGKTVNLKPVVKGEAAHLLLPGQEEKATSSQQIPVTLKINRALRQDEELWLLIESGCRPYYPPTIQQEFAELAKNPKLKDRVREAKVCEYRGSRTAVKIPQPKKQTNYNRLWGLREGVIATDMKRPQNQHHRMKLPGSWRNK